MELVTVEPGSLQLADTGAIDEPNLLSVDRFRVNRHGSEQLLSFGPFRDDRCGIV